MPEPGGSARLDPGPRRALWAIGVVVLLLVVSQLALPPLAESRVQRELEDRYGPVESVSISAFPAVKLLARRADRVEIRMASASVTELQDADLRGIGRLELRIGRLSTLLGSATDVRVDLVGRRATGSMVLDPETAEATNLAADENGVLTGRLIGFPFYVAAEGGNLVARANGGLVTALLPSRTLIEPADLSIDEVRAEPAGTTIRVLASATLDD